MDAVQTPPAPRPEDLRLKVRVTLDTGNGERICELDQEDLLRGILANCGLGTAVRDFEEHFSTLVLSPIRGMIREKVHELRERKGYERIAVPGAPAAVHSLFETREEQSAYVANALRLAAHRMPGGGGVDGDHDDGALLAGSARR
jgi:hypothetical protein